MMRRIVTLAAAACCASTALAQDTKAPKETKPETPKATVPAGEQPKASAPETKASTLTIGDRAPSLKIDKWVKGDPVTEFQSGKVYVVEFWATWCGPCIASMPHNTEVQKKFKSKGVTVIGVTSEDTRGNKLPKVEKMVADKGDENMGYTVAWDSGRKTNEAYMKASGQGGIPCAFIVDKQNRVAWIGHPMKMDEPLQQIVDGKWDMQAFAAEYKKGKEAEKQAAEAQKKAAPLMTALQTAMQGKDWNAAVKACEDLLAADTKQFTPVAAQALNQVAWTNVDPEDMPEKPDLDVALKAAARANELTKGEDPMILDTLARVHFLKGNLDKAIEFQTKAADLSKDNDQVKEEIQGRLDEYKAKKSGK
jgi:thiol-disulfide isomerase/thioredoxin